MNAGLTSNDSTPPRTLVLVVGTGRSGTSLLTGIVRELGYSVPQPELNPNETNPRGFNEPRWVVGFHKRLMDQEQVHTLDSRPGAITRAERAAGAEGVRSSLRTWMSSQLDEHDRLIVKDPRIGYFLGVWRRCARDVGARVVTLSMLRHPAEILDSLERAYGTWQGAASRLAAWLNMTTHVEHVTRDMPRAFVQHADLMMDWRAALSRAGAAAGLDTLQHVSARREARVSTFIEPGLWRSTTSWDDITVPEQVRQLAESVWDDVSALGEDGADTVAIYDRLDRSRRAYRQLYKDAQAIAQLSIIAARREGKRMAIESQEQADSPTSYPNGEPEPEERTHGANAASDSVIGRVSARLRRAATGSSSH